MSELLLAYTARHRYAFRRADVLTIELFTDPDAPAPVGPPRVYVVLGTLFDPTDQATRPRQRALLVPLRRRLVALLVERVETLDEGRVRPLPPLIAARLRQPWAVGVVAIENDVIVQIDLRAVARSALQTQ